MNKTSLADRLPPSNTWVHVFEEDADFPIFRARYNDADTEPVWLLDNGESAPAYPSQYWSADPSYASAPASLSWAEFVAAVDAKLSALGVDRNAPLWYIDVTFPRSVLVETSDDGDITILDIGY